MAAEYDITKARCMNQTIFSTLLSIVRYLHCAAGSPVLSTWIKGIDNNNYATWPGLISQLIRKHLPKSKYTTKGHMRQIKKNLRSTKDKDAYNTLSITSSCKMTTKSIDNVKKKQVKIKCMEISGNLFSNQTGRFPKTLSKVAKYIMVVYNKDTIEFLAEVLTSRS